MSRRARDHRARHRRDERYLDGRAKPEDLDIHEFGWSRSEVRRLWKWERQQKQLLFQDELEYLNWLFYTAGPLAKGKK